MRKSLMAATLALLATSALAQDRTGWPKVINFGLIPLEGSTVTLQKWQPFFDYLSKTLGIPVKPQVGADYTAVIVAMQNKQLELGYFGPKSYVDAVDQAGAQALVKDNTIKGGLGYHSIIISKKGGPITTLDAAKGKNFAFVDPESTSGYLIPMVHFVNDLKTKPDAYFGKVIFAGSHQNAILAVLNGTVDVAATNDSDLANAIKEGQVKQSDLNILWTSPTIPNGPTAARGDLPESFKTAVRNAMIGYKDKKELGVLGLYSWMSARDSDYDVIRAANSVLKK